MQSDWFPRSASRSFFIPFQAFITFRISLAAARISQSEIDCYNFKFIFNEVKFTNGTNKMSKMSEWTPIENEFMAAGAALIPKFQFEIAEGKQANEAPAAHSTSRMYSVPFRTAHFTSHIACRSVFTYTIWRLILLQ